MTALSRTPAAMGRGLRPIAGCICGALTAIGGVGLLMVQLLPGRRANWAGLAAVENSRLQRWYGTNAHVDEMARTRAYFAARAAYGIATAVVVAAGIAGGSAYIAWAVMATALGRAPGLDVVLTTLGLGSVGVYLAYRIAVVAGEWDFRLAYRFRTDDRGRIRELARTRADVITAVDDERRRIERALHDGSQQRLVALGLVLGRLERAQHRGNLDMQRQLLDEARDGIQGALDELRQVASSIYPAALDERGTEYALRALTAHSTLPLDLDYRVTAELPRAVRTAVYFVASESVGNAMKHAQASRIRIDVSQAERSRVAVSIHDDGRGGADPRGTGLIGLRRRVDALDGTFDVSSPPGGPTVIRAELPCES